MRPEERNKELVHEFFALMNRGDVPAIVAAYAPDGYLQTMGRTLISGKYTRAQIEAAAGQIYDVFPQGLTFTIDALTAEGERVAVEAHSEGRHVSGAIYSNEYHFLFVFRDRQARSAPGIHGHRARHRHPLWRPAAAAVARARERDRSCEDRTYLPRGRGAGRRLRQHWRRCRTALRACRRAGRLTYRENAERAEGLARELGAPGGQDRMRNGSTSPMPQPSRTLSP